VLKTGDDATRIANEIQRHTHVLIVGGGIIGTEIAAEIITKHPNKKVTIVHAHQHVIERTSPDAWEYAEEFLAKNGVTFFFSEKVISQTDGVFITDSNHHISADLCIFCTGIQSNPSYMQGFEKECFSQKNFLAVNKYLQLKDHPNIFVGGDINDVDIEKTGHNAKVQGINIAKNIINIKKEKPVEPFKKPYPIVIIGLGDWRGIIYLKRVIVGLMIPGIIKWFVEKLTIIGLKKRW
jgi:NADH dehydrogenase FAD-containing subunit